MRTEQTERNPYQTGERLVPIKWNPAQMRDHGDYGKVDFDNESGETVCTVHVSRNDDGTHTVHVMPFRDGMQVEVHDD
jgi:hypothetical protein